MRSSSSYSINRIYGPGGRGICVFWHDRQILVTDWFGSRLCKNTSRNVRPHHGSAKPGFTTRIF